MEILVLPKERDVLDGNACICCCKISLQLILIECISTHHLSFIACIEMGMNMLHARGVDVMANGRGGVMYMCKSV